jgi:hypothetical protein
MRVAVAALVASVTTAMLIAAYGAGILQKATLDKDQPTRIQPPMLLDRAASGSGSVSD